VSGLTFAARVLLGAVFLVSGALKVGDRRWPEVATAFGTPRWAVPVLPWAEVALGAALAAQVGGPWPPVAALGLLAVFSAGTVVHLARGERVPCGCFGASSERPADGATLARNLFLAALAVLALGPR
jgi:uncharacterized membrane protein YphA (DoxX/SURF4 family)